MKLGYRWANEKDVPILAIMNKQLTEDEGHRNQHQPNEWFEHRIKTFLKSDYKAIIFDKNNKPVSYVLFVNHPDYEDSIYLRQIFVDRSFRRQGIGREAISILKNELHSTKKRLTVGVLTGNQIARTFYNSVGFNEYSIEFEMLVK